MIVARTADASVFNWFGEEQIGLLIRPVAAQELIEKVATSLGQANSPT